MSKKAKNNNSKQERNLYEDGIYYVNHVACSLPIVCVCYSNVFTCTDSRSIFHHSTIEHKDIHSAILKKSS